MDSLKELARKVGAEKPSISSVCRKREAHRALCERTHGLLCSTDEDFGLATLEAMKSGKAVLTTSDSGGILEFTRERETGFISAPGRGSGAGAQPDELYEDRTLR